MRQRVGQNESTLFDGEKSYSIRIENQVLWGDNNKINKGNECNYKFPRSNYLNSSWSREGGSSNNNYNGDDRRIAS